MSHEKIVRHNIICDHALIGLPREGCLDLSRVVTASLPQARAMLKQQGWTRPPAMIGGDSVMLDLCPSCSARAEASGNITKPVVPGRGRPRKIKEQSNG